MEGVSVVDTVICHIHFVKIDYSISDATHFLVEFKSRALNPLSASTKEGPQFVLEEIYGDVLPMEGDGLRIAKRTDS